MITGDFKGGKGAGKTPRKGSCCLNKGGQDTGPFQGCLQERHSSDGITDIGAEGE